jgi:hypothetical protein
VWRARSTVGGVSAAGAIETCVRVRVNAPVRACVHARVPHARVQAYVGVCVRARPPACVCSCVGLCVGLRVSVRVRACVYICDGAERRGEMHALGQRQRAAVRKVRPVCERARACGCASVLARACVLVCA